MGCLCLGEEEVGDYFMGVGLRVAVHFSSLSVWVVMRCLVTVILMAGVLLLGLTLVLNRIYSMVEKVLYGEEAE